MTLKKTVSEKVQEEVIAPRSKITQMVKIYKTFKEVNARSRCSMKSWKDSTLIKYNELTY